MKKPQGMANFFIIWVGQVFSLLGTAMSGFALTIWAWSATGKATSLALVGFFSFFPMVIASPFAGALVDRWNRKLTMMLSDIASGLMTVVVLVLYLLGKLQIWHLFITGAISGIFQAFQWPAYSAAITMIIPKEHYGRAAGLMSVAESGSGILAPIMAAALLGFIGIAGVLAIDLITLAMAVSALLIARVPQPPRTEAGLEAQGSLFKEAGYGFRYIFARPPLLGLQLVFFMGNLLAAIGGTVVAPRILAQTWNNATILGTVQSVAGIGGVLGGIIMSIWGGFKRKIHGVLTGWILSFAFLSVSFGLAQTPLLWAVSSFLGSMIIPIINASNQAIWQSKIPPDIQGKVFSVRRLIAQLSAPISMLIAGPLADNVFEPLMRSQNSLSNFLYPVFGIGPGRGMALMIFFIGVLGILLAASSYLIKPVRDVELLIPDYDVYLKAEVQEEAVPTSASQ
ncbi:MAG: MFS transporter [Coprothermobacterota bacterium]|nr:MFS transporter [Coprothermobacterota bacterium]